MTSAQNPQVSIHLKSDIQDLDGTQVSRRAVLVGSLALPLGTAIMPRFVCADESRPANEAIDATMNAAQEQWINIIQMEPPLDSHQVMDFVGKDFASRQELVSHLNRVGRNNWSSSARNEVAEVTQLAEEYGLSLIPHPSQIVAEAPVILPPNDDELPEPAWIVIVDILIDTLSIGINRELVLRAVQGDDHFRSLMERAAQAVTTRDWTKLANIVDSILTYALSASFFSRIRTVIIQEFGEAAARRILRRSIFRAIVRFVPFMGWIYMSFSILVAIKQNMHRFA